ncbi:hypothetical protein [Noviherbaspirillum sp.]|jgi:hypothetical protein|uniref:hypothetical protein n=1 Tax=Noviherbaspirillum sp. TaxID=1926288 RepID=UPI002F9555DF
MALPILRAASDMKDQNRTPPWLPKPFTIAILDGDAWLGESLGRLLDDGGCRATAFHDAAAFLLAHSSQPFDAYVLDFLADWPAPATLPALVSEICAGGDTPVFILGNFIAPESVPGLGEILMRHKARYQLRPIRADYLARQIREALALKAGLKQSVHTRHRGVQGCTGAACRRDRRERSVVQSRASRRRALPMQVQLQDGIAAFITPFISSYCRRRTLTSDLGRGDFPQINAAMKDLPQRCRRY